MKETKNKTTIFKYFWSHIKNYKGIFSFILILLGIGIFLNDIFVPILYKDFFNLISEFRGNDRGEIFNELFRILIFIALAWLATEIILWRIAGYLSAIFQTKIIKNITDDCFLKIQKHSFDFFADNFAGSLVARIKRMFNAFERIADIFTWNVFPNILRVSFALVVLFSVSPVFAFILLAWIVVYVFVIYLFYSWKVKYDIKVAKIDSRLTGELTDTISNSITIKLFARINYEYKKLFQTTQEKQKTQQLAYNLNEISHIFTGISMVTVEFFMVLFTIKLWIANKISVGEIIMIHTILVGILRNLWHFGHVVRAFYASFADAKEMIDIINLETEVKDSSHPEKCNIQKGHIEFRNINFSYGQTQVFKNLNLEILPGQKIGIVGESGAGKTTLTKILFRFSDLDQGEILIDGQNIANIKQDDLRAKIAFVPQEPILFHRTLLDNIQYGNLNNTKEQIIQAAKDAQAHDFIMQAPEKYDTFVGERGVKLSGGERQRIVIARAMLKNTPILILDEATSSLDSKAENLIQVALDNLMKNRTTIIIAHRLSTLKNLDKIIVFDHGEIVETGSHQDLLNKKGKYHELWSHQVGGFLKQ